MVEIKNIEVFGLNRAINAINNSFNVGEIDTTVEPDEKRWKVAKALGKDMNAHQSHDAFLKGILCEFDLKGNGVFMPEFQRYAVSMNIIMGQSTMHSIGKFMTTDYNPFDKYVDPRVVSIVKEKYNEWEAAKQYLEKVKDQDDKAVKNAKENVYYTFESLVHNLPRGFEQWFTVQSNYLGLKTIVIQRFHHKNFEDWSAVVKACYSMPHFRELCGFEDSKWDIENW